MGGYGVEGNKPMQPLFETKQVKGRVAFCRKSVNVKKCFKSSTIYVGICLILVYRLKHIPSAEEHGRWAWTGLFMAELWFGFYWILTQSVRWNVIYRVTFKERLLHRNADKLPGVDIFVCAADPTIEPPTLVVNTVLSAMAYNYPTEKLSVYISDDGCSELTFYALLEAPHFSKHWIPFCKKFKVEPRSPEAYFTRHIDSKDIIFVQEWSAVKKPYKEMKNGIKSMVEACSIRREMRAQHKGFSEWNSKVSKQEHQSIVQILIAGRDTNAVDNTGHRLPTLVYMAREKRPQWHHSFKAGAINALSKVSSQISNANIIHSLDCDMYSNNLDTIKDALCFFMDEERGHKVSYVQFPQNYNNLKKNNIYASPRKVINEIEVAGVDGYGGAFYCGMGCFHRRESLCGRKYSKNYRGEWKRGAQKNAERTVDELEEASTVLANCSYEKDTLWGKEVMTASTNIQDKRWSEGLFQILLSKYCPLLYGYGKVKLGARLGYCVYLVWAPTSSPMLYYMIVPPLFLLHGIALFPELSCGETFKTWWNFERMWMMRLATSYLFAFIDNLTMLFGLSETTFAITAKVADEDVLKRYQHEIIEFGSSSLMFTIILTLALLNLFSSVGGIKKVVFNIEFRAAAGLIPHVILCGVTVMLHVPVYEALFVRNDKGRIPSSVMFKSIIVASLACLMPYLLYN
ncbi:hypothetical protein PVL29_025871 [Vitis rotundifolia]|uniref:Cellulose synthase-like protein E1 n=1 Tax=Vitis rotundifolia TaxID=103349 RepID=A0AA39D7V6_VITRO|nr:hypothetical protein PVL29_025871 [Vitis rotundifolia]